MIYRIIVLLFFYGVASAQSPPPSGDGTLTPLRNFQRFYGIYLNRAKVGFMETSLTWGKQIQLSVQLSAQVRGMGTTSGIELTEQRVYEAQSGQLLSLLFRQKAATGETRVEGKRDGTTFHLIVTAGGQSQKQSASVSETLTDALADVLLAQKAEINSSRTIHRFDPSILRTVRVQYRVVNIEKRMFAGVSGEAVLLETRYPDLGVTEQSWLDRQGQVLETHVGGFFVARLEPKEVAKRLDVAQDLLISAVVKSPVPIINSANLEQLDLTFSGFPPSHTPPGSQRQLVQATGDNLVRLQLHRDATPANVPFTPTGARTAYKETAVQKALEATPFIQSDHPSIIRAAQKATALARDVFSAITNLTHFVYSHVVDEYVPSYSNALEALTSGRGDCTEHSILFVALARAVGIPARVAVGIAYWPPGEGFGWHAWNEVFVKDRWIAVDPTWNQPIADTTHIKLAEGDPAEQARIVMLLGSLQITAVETTGP